MGGLLSTQQGGRIGLLGGGQRATLEDEIMAARYAARNAPPAAPVAPPPAPNPQPPAGLPGQTPRRGRVSGWRVFDRFLGGQTVTEGLDAERARLETEAQRPQLLARQARIQSYVDTLSPDLQLAFAANPEKLAEALASRAEGRVLDQGDVYLEGGRPAYAAPFEAAPGSSVFDPLNPTQRIGAAPSENKVAGGALVTPEGQVLYRGPQVEGVAGTADAFVTPEIAGGVGGGAPRVVREARPDSVTLGAGGEIVTLDANGAPVSRVASSQARPISDSDQAAIARAEASLALSATAVGRAQSIIQQLDSGSLNLGPLTNVISEGRNRIGQSDQNSLNYEELRNWAKGARDAILQANTGVQTDQDAIRALDLILSSAGDERVVRQSVQRFVTAATATQQVLRRDIDRRSGQGAPGAPAAAGQVVSVSTPAQALALSPGTRYRTPDGQEYIR